MGLRERALKFKESGKENRLDQLDTIYQGRVLNQQDINELKSAIETRIMSVSRSKDENLRYYKVLLGFFQIMENTEDRDSLLSLAMETLETGLEVTKGLLFVKDQDQYRIKRQIGFSDALDEHLISLSKQEEALLTHNEPGISMNTDINSLVGMKDEECLFSPFNSTDDFCGGFIVYSIKKEKIAFAADQEIETWLDLFSRLCGLIGSRLGLIQKLELTSQPVQSTLKAMEETLDQAKALSIPVTFSMLKLINLPYYVQFYGSADAKDKCTELERRLRNTLDQNSKLLHYSMGKYLFILPILDEVLKKDADSVILRTASDLFKNSQKIDIGLTIDSAHYPDQGDHAYQLLQLIE